RGRAEEEAARFLPGQPFRLRHALMSLSAGELAVAAVVGLVPPDARRLGEHRVTARAHPRVVGPPPVAVDDDLVADPHVLYVAAGGPDDAGAVAAAGVEVLGLPRLLALADHVEWRAQRRPDVVVVDPRRHHVDQRLVGAEGRRWDDLAPPRLARRTEAVLAHDVRVHALRHFAEGRSLAEIVQVSHVASGVCHVRRRTWQTPEATWLTCTISASDRPSAKCRSACTRTSCARTASVRRARRGGARSSQRRPSAPTRR